MRHRGVLESANKAANPLAVNGGRAGGVKRALREREVLSRVRFYCELQRSFRAAVAPLETRLTTRLMEGYLLYFNVVYRNIRSFPARRFLVWKRIASCDTRSIPRTSPLPRMPQELRLRLGVKLLTAIGRRGWAETVKTSPKSLGRRPSNYFRLNNATSKYIGLWSGPNYHTPVILGRHLSTVKITHLK